MVFGFREMGFDAGFCAAARGTRPGLSARSQSCVGTGKSRTHNRTHNRTLPALFRSKKSPVSLVFSDDSRGENLFRANASADRQFRRTGAVAMAPVNDRLRCAATRPPFASAPIARPDGRRMGDRTAPAGLAVGLRRRIGSEQGCAQGKGQGVKALICKLKPLNLLEILERKFSACQSPGSCEPCDPTREVGEVGDATGGVRITGRNRRNIRRRTGERSGDVTGGITGGSGSPVPSCYGLEKSAVLLGSLRNNRRKNFRRKRIIRANRNSRRTGDDADARDADIRPRARNRSVDRVLR